jgi:hypothetical protein
MWSTTSILECTILCACLRLALQYSSLFLLTYMYTLKWFHQLFW